MEEKIIKLYPGKSKKAPLLVLNTYGEEGEKIHELARSLTQKDFTLLTISELDWNADMTPWAAKSIFKGGEDFAGNAGGYLEELRTVILPEVIKKYGLEPEWIGIAGYSLGGLFALYSGFCGDSFQRIVSASGSLWYPGFIEYVAEQRADFCPQKVYLSLGELESKTRNPVMKTVGERTKTIYEWLTESKIEAIYEKNPGNHFTDEALRVAKGIAWIL